MSSSLTCRLLEAAEFLFRTGEIGIDRSQNPAFYRMCLSEIRNELLDCDVWHRLVLVCDVHFDTSNETEVSYRH